MAVRMTGGNSGQRSANYLPPVPSSGSPQPIQSTETSGGIPSSVYLQADHPTISDYQSATPDFMPTGGTEAHGTDLEDPSCKQYGPTSGE